MLRSFPYILFIFILAMYVHGDGGESNKPEPPPEEFTNEVDAAGVPEGIEELEKIKKEKEDLIKKIAEVEESEGALVKKIQELRQKKETLTKNLEVSNLEITRLIIENQDLKDTISSLRSEINKPPGVLFSGWIYTSKLKWVYTSPTIYPYAYSQIDGWLKYDTGSNPRRVFYYNDNQWKVLE